VTLIGTPEFLQNVKQLLADFSTNLDWNKLQFLSLSTPMSPWHKSQLFFELKSLTLSSNSNKVFFLSVSPYTAIAVFIYNLKRKLLRKQLQEIVSIYHGLLANLLPRNRRPDPYIFRKGTRIVFHPIKFLLQPSFTIPVSNSTIGRMTYLVISPHIVECIKSTGHKYPHFRVFTPRIKRFESRTTLSEGNASNKFTLMVIGRSPGYELNKLITLLIDNRVFNIELLLDEKYKESISGVEKNELIKFVNLKSRRDIVRHSCAADSLLMLRTSNELCLRLSGAMLESFALNKPIILPWWIREVSQTLQPKIGATYYDSVEDLVRLLAVKNS
jgi:hypothetical protein